MLCSLSAHSHSPFSTAQQEGLPGAFKVVTSCGDPITWGQALHLLKERDVEGKAFRDLMLQSVREASPPSVFFESVPVAADALDSTIFEFIILDAPNLKGMPEPGPFHEHIAAGEGTDAVASFYNLGGDARLVSPCWAGANANANNEAEANAAAGAGAEAKAVGLLESYTHLKNFVTGAPISQQHNLLIELGEALATELKASKAPRWVSTAGMGVNWLHFRIDTFPKYYRHLPYKVYGPKVD